MNEIKMRTLSGITALLFGVGGLAGCSGSIGTEPHDSGPKSDGSEGPVVDSGPDAHAAVTACTANFTIENVAFYGSGTEAPPASSCPPTSPPFAAITSSSNAVLPSGEIYFGVSTYLWNVYTAESAGQAKPTVSLTPSTGALNVALGATASADGGSTLSVVGLAFSSGTSCVNASAYSGIQFTITGDLGGCSLRFYVDDAEDSTPAQSGNDGLCTALECGTPSYAVNGTGTIMVPFTSPSGGTPLGPVPRFRGAEKLARRPRFRQRGSA
jgi:hypothetical protein